MTDHVRKELAACLAALHPHLEAFPWNERVHYADWLSQTYYYVSHSTRLLALAASRFTIDPRGNELHRRFGEHIGEEKRHEALCVNDLEHLGAQLAPERPSTRMLYECQYYKIEHRDPMALFGHILLLEALASSAGWILERIENAFGRKCSTFVRVHVSDDPDHIDKALLAIASCTSDQLELIIQTLHQSTAAYRGILSEIFSAHRPP